jgi:DNA-directed RNA polymerase subunit alpha
MATETKTELVEPKVTVEELTENAGRVVIEPLMRGFGTTLGNALRRVLLSAIPGAAITRVRFSKSYHEYDTLPGVKESLLEILLNLKGLAIRLNDGALKHLYLHAKGAGEVTAGQLECESGVEIVNEKHLLATLDEESELEIEMEVEPGFGYRPAERNKKKDSPLGVLAIDSDFSPVKRVNFVVEETRVGERTDYDRLKLEWETNGGIKPEEALSQASQILMKHLGLFSDFAAHPYGLFKDTSRETEALEASLETLQFDQRACNLLKTKGITTLGDLLAHSRQELMDIHGFGTKTLDKVILRLKELGYSLRNGNGAKE